MIHTASHTFIATTVLIRSCKKVNNDTCGRRPWFVAQVTVLPMIVVYITGHKQCLVAFIECRRSVHTCVTLNCGIWGESSKMHACIFHFTVKGSCSKNWTVFILFLYNKFKLDSSALATTVKWEALESSATYNSDHNRQRQYTPLMLCQGTDTYLSPGMQSQEREHNSNTF